MLFNKESFTLVQWDLAEFWDDAIMLNSVSQKNKYDQTSRQDIVHRFLSYDGHWCNTGNFLISIISKILTGILYVKLQWNPLKKSELTQQATETNQSVHFSPLLDIDPMPIYA